MWLGRQGCDACKKGPKESTVILCVECSSREANKSVSFCADCFTSGNTIISVSPENKSDSDAYVQHRLHHYLLQIRSPHLRFYRQPMLAAAKTIAEWADEHFTSPSTASPMLVVNGIMWQARGNHGHDAGMHCVACERKISARPYWCCVTCTCAYSLLR